MNVELIRAKTADGLRLDGSLQRPEVLDSSAKNTVWLLVHGTGSNFYSSDVLRTFAEQLVCGGSSVARINTRGHDIISALPGARMPLSGGAAFESIADCVHDLRAWVDELIRRDFSRVLLVGHSMGGVKAIFSQAHDPHPNVAAVIGVSPPRFCHAEWQSSPHAAPFREHFLRATELVESHRGGELMLVQQPLPLWLTAAGFLAKYGPHDDYDFVPLLPRLIHPTLLIVGTASVESSPAFASVPDAVRQLQTSQPQLQFRLVSGANTGYSEHLDAPARLACEWFASVVNRKG
ncbi:MAG: alpha/beta fold hydrolase [Planctomycetaceae bacterium]|nr:alpha/beta fold hydrolase [Planctomycetaceae bacterium]